MILDLIKISVISLVIYFIYIRLFGMREDFVNYTKCNKLQWEKDKKLYLQKQVFKE